MKKNNTNLYKTMNKHQNILINYLWNNIKFQINLNIFAKN